MIKPPSPQSSMTQIGPLLDLGADPLLRPRPSVSDLNHFHNFPWFTARARQQSHASAFPRLMNAASGVDTVFPAAKPAFSEAPGSLRDHDAICTLAALPPR